MSIVFSILKHYDTQPIDEVEYLGGAGGFSGAQIWKIHCAGGSSRREYCLRRWPSEHPTPQRLDWINLVLSHVFHQGCPVAAPMSTVAGGYYVNQHGFLWELAPWKAGRADFHAQPNSQRLASAMECLAKFHLAAAQVSLDFQLSETAVSRFEQLNSASPVLEAIRRAAIPKHLPLLGILRERVLVEAKSNLDAVINRLRPHVAIARPVQPVIRDVWHDHILFTGDQVTGLVDFGAMRMDSVSVDLSRLLGSLLGGPSDKWDRALEAYQHYRQLAPAEIQFAKDLDSCTCLLSGMNWLKWILVDQREFESWENVDRRVNAIISRLAESGKSTGG